MNREIVGSNVRLARVRNNLTQEQLAEMADISSSYLSAIERGKQSVSLEYMNRIADALRVPVANLLVREREEGYAAQTGTGGCNMSDRGEGPLVTRRKRLNQINEMLSECGDRELQIVQEEISLLMNKFRYFDEKAIR
nr:helix-turn-helix transcriptional regulator [Lachnospiraceae bacterium]